MKILVTSHYGTLPRGSHAAMLGRRGNEVWADHDAEGWIVISEPGVWLLYCTDGKRFAHASLSLSPNGEYDMSGNAAELFTVVKAD